MSIFFLHLRDHDELIEDPVGQDFADLDGAQAEAEQSAREMMAADLREGKRLDGQQIEICDKEGKLLATVRFRDVLDRMRD